MSRLNRRTMRAVVGSAAMAASLLAASTEAQEIPREEFRAAWLCTVSRLDWPPNPNTNSPAQQRAAMRNILDKYVELNINAVIFQIRSEADAQYVSELEPWSRYLTGANGTAPDPLWDPLQYLIDESRRRGIEVHAWLNPYRAGVNRNLAFSNEHVSHPSNPMSDTLVRTFESYFWFDPGHPKVREYGVEIVMDVVRRYDIDAIHFDDYFYPYSISASNPFPDTATFNQFNDAGFDLGDFRRDSVNAFVEEVYTAIRNEPGKEHVRFGLSPFGIWRPGNPPGISGLDSFTQIFADSRLWFREGWVDYMTPQLYWFRAADGNDSRQDYDTLLPWWADSAQNVFGRHLWPGIPNYKIGTARTGASGNYTAQHLVNMITSTRNVPGATGNIHFRTGNLMSNGGAGVDGVSNLLAANHYAEPALIPPTTWLPGTDSLEPAAIGFTGSGPYTLRWQQPAELHANTWLLRTVESGNVRFRVLPGWQEEATIPASASEATLTAVDRLGNRGVPVEVDFSQPMPAPAPSLVNHVVQNFQGATAGTTNYFFQRPGFGTASSGVEPGGTSTLTGTEFNHIMDPRAGAPSVRSSRLRWEWDQASANRFLRLTTFGGDTASNANPALDLSQGIGFYFKLPEGSLDISLQVRETGGSGPVGSNGGSAGDIERSEFRRVNASANWQYIYFDIPNLEWSDAFTGDGTLDGDWGVLESLGIRQVDGEPVRSFTLYIDNMHQGTPHTPLGPPAMPQGLAAEAGDEAGSIRVSWRELNTESNFAGYHLYRAPVSESITFSPLHRIAVLPAGTTEFLDTMVLDGTEYQYRLVSVNDRTALSVPTSVVTASATPRSTNEAPGFVTPGNEVRVPIASTGASGFAPGGGNGAFDSRSIRISGTTRGDLEFGAEANDEFFTRTGTEFPTGGFFRTTLSGNEVFGLRPSMNEMPRPRIEYRVRNNSGGEITSVDIDFTLFMRNSGSRASTLRIAAEAGGSETELVSLTSPRRRTSAGWQQVPVDTSLSFAENPIQPGEYFTVVLEHKPVDGAGDFDEFAHTDIVLNFEGDGGGLTPVESDVWMVTE